MMGRRKFITLLGGAAAVWPVAVWGQQSVRPRLIGFVTGLSASELRPLIAAFRARLQELGWFEDRNVIIDARATAGDFDRLVADAEALASANADVIVAVGTPGLRAVQQHTSKVPVVFLAVTDPVGLGFIGSLAHPGGNATGLTNFEFAIGSKWLQLLRELDRNVSHATLITNPANPNTAPLTQAIASAAKTMGVDIFAASVGNASDIERVIVSTNQRPGGALIIFPDSLPVTHNALIIRLAEQQRLPTIYPFRVFTTNGGLISYGLDLIDIYQQAAVYVHKILRGSKPAELPVQAPNKFELVINLRTAKALGITVPPSLLATADEVIE
jgi:putative ABC transport system substrate-binding protein